MGSPGRPKVKPDQEEQRERLSYYLRVLYRGNQRVMADAAGVTQSFVSKILSGAQQPSAGFLDTLSRQPLVNPAWLLRGEGEPLLPSTAGTLPVSDLILPGTPSAYPDLIGANRHAVATPLESSTRYFFRVPPTSDIVLRSELAIRAGDLLLIETAADVIHRLDVVLNQICALRITLRNVDSYAFGRVFVDGANLCAEVYDRDLLSFGMEPKSKADAFFASHRKRHTPRVDTPKEDLADEAITPSPTMKPAVAPHQQILSGGIVQLRGVEDIVGIVLMLERPGLYVQAGSGTVR